MEIPTNRPIQRKDLDDVVYRTEAGKFRAVVRDIIAAHEKGQAGTGWHGYNRKIRNTEQAA